MNSFLLNRQLGSISPETLAQAQRTRLLKSLQAAPEFKIGLARSEQITENGPRRNEPLAHIAGVNSIAIDRFEGRYLISAGADSSLAIWDLEAPTVENGENSGQLLPLALSARTSATESLGITHLSFYPFDSLALLTSGYDHTLKLFSSETLTASASFDLGSTVYSHATSTIATHLLVACASHHPAVRLVDLRSGAHSHALAGHTGAVLTVAWHPRNEHILASGAADGVVRLWDIRRSASSLGVLDAEDSVGLAGYDGRGTGARRRERGRAHAGAVNGLVFTPDARALASVGHDARMRVWDLGTGANTLVDFGPGLKNGGTTALLPLLAPREVSERGAETVFYPNPREVLAFDLHSGRLRSRLRVVGAQPGAQRGDGNVRERKNRTTSLAWRAHHVEMYSAHGDGTIRCWRPRTWEDAVADKEDARVGDAEEGESEGRKRKREEFEQIVQNLTKEKITFS